MSDIQFEENQSYKRPLYSSPSEKGMIGYLIKRGLAKDNNAAQIVLLFVALFFFAMSALAFVIL